jgi:hypothetical protein
MWGRRRKSAELAEGKDTASPLRSAVRQARIEAAERLSVVVDLHDAEVARLELLNEALDPLFAEIPAEVDLFDRGLSSADTPRLWIDAVAHVAMGRDKRIYRFLLDSRIGRGVLAESHDIADIVKAVTDYVARRLIERERSLEGEVSVAGGAERRKAARFRSRRRWRAFGLFVGGFFLGVIALAVAAFLLAGR